MRLLLNWSLVATRNALKFPSLPTFNWRCVFRGSGVFEMMHAFFTWSRTVRLIVSSHQFHKIVETVFHVFNLGTEFVRHDLHEQSRAALLIWRSVHQAQLSVSFENVVSSFPHDFPCSFLCEHREKVQQGCRLLIVWWSRHHHCFQQGRIGRIVHTRVSVECEVPVVKVFARCVRLWLSDSHCTRVSVEREVPVVKVFARCVRLWLPDSHVLWARFRHRLSHCSHGFRESCHRCVHRSARRLLTNVNICAVSSSSWRPSNLTSWAVAITTQYHKARRTGSATMQEWETTQNVFKCAVHNGWCELFSRDPTWAQDVWVWEECHCRVYCNRRWCDKQCNHITRVQQANLALILCTVSSTDRMQTPQEQKVNPSRMCFKHEWYWTVLDICPNSYNSMLRWTSTSFLVFPDLQQKISCVSHFLIFTLLFRICPILSSSSKITSCAIPSILRSTLNSGYFFLKTWLSTSLHFPGAGSSGLSVGLPCSSFCISFLMPEDALSDVSCCCCCFCCGCCDSQAPLSTIFGAGRGVESLSNKVRSPFLRNHAQSCIQLRHGIWFAKTVVPRLVLGLSWSSRRRPEFFSTHCDGVLFSALRGHRWVPSSSGLSPNGLRGVKKLVCFPSLHSLPPAMSPVSRIELMLKDQPLWNTKFSQLYGIATWPINWGAIRFPQMCPYIARIFNKNFWECMQYWNLILLLPS